MEGQTPPSINSASREVKIHPYGKSIAHSRSIQSEMNDHPQNMTLRGSGRPHTNGNLEADGLQGHSGVNHGGFKEHAKKQEIFTGRQGILGKGIRLESAPGLPGSSLDYAWPQCSQKNNYNQGPEVTADVLHPSLRLAASTLWLQGIGQSPSTHCGTNPPSPQTETPPWCSVPGNALNLQSRE